MDILNKRIIAIDYGSKRTGIAVCDEFHITTTPLVTLNTQSDSFIQDILQIIRQRNIQLIVVGYPDSDNSKNIQKKISGFIDAISLETSIEIVKYNESFSSKDAVEALISIGKKKNFRRKKSNIDKTAAAIILKNFLEDFSN